MSADHDGCRRARLDGDGWRCTECGADLGYGTTFVAWVPGLKDLGRIHRGVRTFGLPASVRLRGEPRGDLIVTTSRGREFYAYCPVTGCGTGQHVSLTPQR